MTFNVAQRGAHVATFRWIEVRLMETLATWTPTTPEMEAKLLFGAHIWDAAQHADILGKRTHELRLPLQHSIKPVAAYVEYLDALLASDETWKRIAGFYDCALPALERRFEAYLANVDELLDGPTVRLIERIRYDMRRMVGESRKLREELPAFRVQDRPWLDALCAREGAVAKLAADVAAPEPARALP
jgi:hypothetical protein